MEKISKCMSTNVRESKNCAGIIETSCARIHNADEVFFFSLGWKFAPFSILLFILFFFYRGSSSAGTEAREIEGMTGWVGAMCLIYLWEFSHPLFGKEPFLLALASGCCLALIVLLALLLKQHTS
jgi:hypothetical protein